VTHMFGNPADMAAIRGVCDEHGLLLFEDCAHAVGTLGADGVPVGQSGDGALFSFGIHKIVNTFGGGALAVRSDLYNPDALPAHRPSRTESLTGTLSRAAASVAMFPSVGPWIFQPVIELSRMLARLGSPRLSRVLEPARDNPEYRFAVDERAPFKDFMRPMLALQLQRLEDNVAKRRAVRAGVRERLADVGAIGWLDEDAHGRSNAAYFGIRVPAPAGLARFLIERGVMSNPREFYDCSRLPQFASSAATCEHSARLSDELLRLPSYPDLTASQIDRIADGIRAYFARPVTTA
jgi:dTDP-4-amino-4,6-dideoxygalactose transaminase